ncbi:fructoselysine 6-kinase [Roseburia hominis]
MKIAVIGDNCIDIYPKLDKKYPTGNIVDTGVNLKILGASVSVISTTGSDFHGRWMYESLQKAGLDVSHLKVENGATAVTYMDMNGLDRVHGEYLEGVLETMSFDEEDISFCTKHDWVHSAIWGMAENTLEHIKKQQVPISFDYSNQLEHPLVEKTLPFVDYGFFSYPAGRDAYIEQYLKDKVDRGMKVAVATFGDQGSLAYDGARFYRGQIVQANLVNTVGAGDSFIAGFIYEYSMSGSIEQALDKGAQVAAKVVSVFGPWQGCPVIPAWQEW